MVAPVLFVGGVAMNEAVRWAMAQVFRLPDAAFVQTQLPYCLSALGAALFAAEQKERPMRIAIGALAAKEPGTAESASRCR